VQLGAVADWWCSWPMANMLACSCSCQRRTFWTCFVTINLFSLYLMNFTFHTILDAADDVPRVHYKRMKCDVPFSQCSISTIFRWGWHFSYMCKKILSAYNSAKIIFKIDRDFPKLWLQMYCHFLWFTV